MKENIHEQRRKRKKKPNYYPSYYATPKAAVKLKPWKIYTSISSDLTYNPGEVWSAGQPIYCFKYVSPLQ